MAITNPIAEVCDENCFWGPTSERFFTALTKQNDPDRWLPAKGGYYGSLYRYQDKSAHDRAGTLAAIASEIIIDQFVDWGLNEKISQPIKDIAQFDARRADRSEYDTGAVFSFSEHAINCGVFSPGLYEILQKGGSEREDFYQSSTDEKKQFAIQQLGHIIHSSIGAYQTSSYLALTKDDTEILRLLSNFAIANNTDIAFPLPDLSELNFADDELMPSAV